MRVLAMIFALGAAIGAASCRDNRMSESFDHDEASNEVAPDEDLQESGARGSTGADDELLRGE